MRILIIPSWHPYPAIPYAGRFFVEQAKALATHTEHEYILLNWGQNEFQLQIRHPMASLAKLFKYLVATKQISHIAPNLRELSLPHISWTSLCLKGNIAALAQRLPERYKPDLIHAHVSFPAGYLAYQLSQKWRIPYVITEHSGPFPLGEFVTRKGISPLITKPLAQAAKIIAVSSALQAEILAKTGMESWVIPNLVDTDFFSPGEAHGPHRCFRLFSLSVFTEAKGVMDLLEAFKLLVHNGITSELYLGGDGPLKKTMLSYIKAKRLPVVLLGNLSRMQALHQYQSCDCYIMPSRVESFSMVLIEALACGKPVIATACGGPSDIVNSASGLLVLPQNPAALAQAMQQMNETHQSYTASNIRADCIDRFGSASVCQKIAACYQAALVSAKT